MTEPKIVETQIAWNVRVALAQGGEVVLQIQTMDGACHNYTFAPSQIRGIRADMEKALNFHTEAGCTNEK